MPLYSTFQSPGTLTSLTGTDVPLTLVGAALQSASLLRAKNSSGTTLFSINPEGRLSGPIQGVDGAGFLSMKPGGAYVDNIFYLTADPNHSEKIFLGYGSSPAAAINNAAFIWDHNTDRFGVGSQDFNPAASLHVKSFEPDTDQARALLIDTSTTWTTSGARLFSVKNSGSEKFSIDQNGIVSGTVFVVTTLTSSDHIATNYISALTGSYIYIEGNAPDVPGAEGVIIDNSIPFTHSASHLVSFRNGGNEVAWIDKDGNASFSGTIIFLTGSVSGNLAIGGWFAATGSITTYSTISASGLAYFNGANAGNSTIQNVADPINNQDAVTKKWVIDNVISGSLAVTHIESGSYVAAVNSSSLAFNVTSGTNVLMSVDTSANGYFSGNLGIGVASPAKKLVVAGDAVFGANSWLTASDTGGGNGRLQITGIGSVDYGSAFMFRSLAQAEHARFTSIGLGIGNGGNPAVALDITGTDPTFSIWATTNSRGIKITPSTSAIDAAQAAIYINRASTQNVILGYGGGQVAVGTNAPAAGFHVRASGVDGGTAIGTVIDTSASFVTAGSKLLSIRNSGSEKAYFDRSGSLYIDASGTNAITTALTLVNSANSSTPGVALELQPIGSVASARIYNQYYGGNMFFAIQTRDQYNGTLRDRYAISGPNGGLAVQHLWYRNDGAEAMRIDEGGNLTIGGQDPISKFSVLSGSTTPIAYANSLADFTGITNSYHQINVRNASSGNMASGDVVISRDDGTDTTGYIDIGINNSGFSTGSWTINGAGDAYVYGQTSNLSIGTADAKYLSFFTNGTLAANERMRIDATGSVGIGTSTPTALLHVSGGDLRADSTASFYKDVYVRSSTSAVSPKLYFSGTGSSNSQFLMSSGSKLHVYDSSGLTGRLTIDGFNGSVGINKMDPSGSLHVVNVGLDSATAVIQTMDTIQGWSLGKFMSFKNNGVEKAWISASGGGTFMGQVNFGSFVGSTAGVAVVTNATNTTAVRLDTTTNHGQIRIFDASNNNNIKFLGSGNSYISGTGNNLGVGTSAPATALHVVGTARVDSTISITGTVDQTVVKASTTTSASSQQVDTWSISTYRSCRYQIQMTSGSAYHMTNLSVIHDGTTAYATEFGAVMTAASLGTFEVQISTGNVQLLFSPTGTTNSLIIDRTAFTLT